MKSKLLLIVLALFLIAARAPEPSASVQVLCDGKTYSGFSSPVIKIDNTDAATQKVIRNCTFENGSASPVVIPNARNVLIENSTFDHILSGKVGVGTFGIGITCRPTGSCIVDNVTIRNSHFDYIGADGIQVGVNDNNISNVTIENNEFIGHAHIGENGVDIKGVTGPVIVRGNVFAGFRPCDGSKDFCTGSTGPGMTVHEGSSGAPNDVLIEDNDFTDNIIGLSVSNAGQGIVIRNNRFTSNAERGAQVLTTLELTMTDNSFDDNPLSAQIEDTPRKGGTCTVSGNIILSGDAIHYKNSNCQTSGEVTSIPKNPTATVTTTATATRTPTMTPTATATGTTELPTITPPPPPPTITPLAGCAWQITEQTPLKIVMECL